MFLHTNTHIKVSFLLSNLKKGHVSFAAPTVEPEKVTLLSYELSGIMQVDEQWQVRGIVLKKLLQ